MKAGKSISDFDWGYERSSIVHWILPKLLMCLSICCVVLYVSLVYISTQLQNYERSIQKKIETVKSREHKILTQIARITLQQNQTIQRQNAFVENIISRASVLFSDVEMYSQRFERNHRLLKKTGPLEYFNEQIQLSYNNEHARRRIENIVRELWNFVHCQLLDFETTAEIHTENPPRYSLVLQTLNETTSSHVDIEKNITMDDIITSKREQVIVTSTSESMVEQEVNFIRQKLDTFTSTFKKKLHIFKTELTGYKRSLLGAFDLLRNADHADTLRLMMSMALGNIVHERLNILQKTNKCDRTKMHLCKMKACGFGCKFHHVVYCLITAYATNKRVIVEFPTVWLQLFEPAHKCVETIQKPDVVLAQMSEKNVREDNNKHANDEYGNEKGANNDNSNIFGEISQMRNAIELPYIDDLSSDKGYIPLSVPQDIAQKLATFHGNPAAWWIGHIASFLFKPTELLMNHLRHIRRTQGFQKPIVGVHVRRTDKVFVEAQFHYLEEYMLHVEDYYNQLQRSIPGVIRRVFLATDDEHLLWEARLKYPNYTFVSDNKASRVIVENRDLLDSVMGVAGDIYFLSRSDFLVCTFSSQVCRLAYELMQTLHGDASQYFRSLDDIYYFGGQNKHKMTALESHHPDVNWPDTINMKKGDTILVQGNHWNGFSKGINERTQEIGFYPSYKVEDTIAAVKMPVD